VWIVNIIRASLNLILYTAGNQWLNCMYLLTDWLTYLLTILLLCLLVLTLCAGEVNTSEMLVNMSAGSLEDFYPAIAVAILMRYIRDPSLSQHHRTVVQAITFIFKSLGSKCIPYLSQVVPAYLHVIRASEACFREVNCYRVSAWLFCISLLTTPAAHFTFCFSWSRC